ncbi:anoctamin-like protein At1g73020 isoform X2 [Mangifera indica]|uniref:anoctamin-like protein At1g73020 isoform X2 n=1 Tax=Mangifera indica TaxID=29780 RepID=UPI001CFC3720|nr:anoctamin-like protein At1g73020 isoform X2 [Mangifera indica]
MNGHGEEEIVYEIGVVVPKSNAIEGQESRDCVEILEAEFRKVGLIVDRVSGVSDEFIKVAAPLETLGRAAAEMQMWKPTHIGMDLQFEWEEVDAFVKQPDGSLFSWYERFQCYQHLLYGIVSKSDSGIILNFDGKEFLWEVGQSLVKRLESEGIIKQVFPLHDETKRRKLLRSWALNWWDLTEQPIDEIYSYYGTKIAIYFAFLGKYTRWMFFPAAFGLILQTVDFGWHINCTIGASQGNKLLGLDHSPPELMEKMGMNEKQEKQLYQRYEWLGYLMRFRNDAIIILSIICLQLPFELAYAHLYEVIGSDLLKFGLTGIYLFFIQYFTQFGGKISVKLIKYENNENTEYRADSLVYKVFGLYFMQSYIGIFYHALLHRNFTTLRKVLIQRLMISEVLENLLENCSPYLKYSYKKYRTIRNKKKHEKGSSSAKICFTSRVEKEYLKPAYSASIGDEVEDGLFDDFLELALQFGMIMMFACAFPLAFAFTVVNNIMEIRTDALKLLSMLKRPVPRAATSIGAWINIFQFLIVMSICTNSALLVWLYDEEGKWKVEPGLAGILIMEHILLLIKFGFSRLLPEEPAWVRANRAKNATHAQNVCSKQLLRNISGGEKTLYGQKKME